MLKQRQYKSQYINQYGWQYKVKVKYLRKSSYRLEEMFGYLFVISRLKGLNVLLTFREK